MKKLLTAAVLIASVTAANAQGLGKHIQSKKWLLSPTAKILGSQPSNSANSAARTASIAVFKDTLSYFMNKDIFISGSQYAGYIGSYAMTVPANDSNFCFTEMGSSFLNGSISNPGSAVTVHGAWITVGTISVTASVPVTLYLYNADGAGKPLNKLDSATANISGTGGQLNFFYIPFAAPKTVNNSFYISFKNSGLNSDTIYGGMDQAFLPPTAMIPVSLKFGESLSYDRFQVKNVNGAYIFDTLVVSDNEFTNGGDSYEALVAPAVTFSINTDFTASAPNSTTVPGAYCTLTAMNFTNTSNSTHTVDVMVNKQFNFNTFINYWTPTTAFNNTAAVIVAADPINLWQFSDIATTYTTQNATHTPTLASSLTVTLTTNYRANPGFVNNFQKASTLDTKVATYSVVACTTGTHVGIQEISGFEAVSIYPNPTVNGKTSISGLNGTNTILVYDVLGQQVSNQISDKETITIDLLNKANGTYIIKLINSNNDAKVVRIINQN